MDLAGTYEKTQLIGNGDVQVWRGRNRATGNQVLLHQFTGNGRLLHLAVRYLLNRPPDSPLLAMGELPEGTCLVTNYDLELLDITAWLEATLLANRAAPGPQATPVPPPQFLLPLLPPLLLRNRHNSARGLSRPRGSTGPLPSRARRWNPRPKPPSENQPGEFTRAFQLPGSAGSSSRPQDPLAGARLQNLPPVRVSLRGYFRSPDRQAIRAVPAPLDSERLQPHRLRRQPCRNGRPHRPLPGEFTRMFRPPAAATGAPWAPPADTSSGGFSVPAAPKPQPPPLLPDEPRRFEEPYKGSGAGQPSAPPVVSSPLAEPSAPPTPAGPSEYTRVIQTQRPPTPPPQSPAATSSSPVLPSPALAQAVPLPTPASVTPSMPVVPSVQAPVVPSTPSMRFPPATANAPAPTPARPRSGLSPLVILFGGLVLVALVLVLVFALRK